MTKTVGPTLTVENILPGLMPLVVPLEWVRALPDNPRRGKIDAIARSYKRFGMRKPLVARMTGQEDGHPVGYAEAGNHQRAAMIEMGWKYAAVLWVDEDETEAFAFSLADNRTHDLGTYDADSMGAAIAKLTGAPDLLTAAGFDADAISRIARQTTVGALGQAEGADQGSGMESRGLGTPVVATTIVFDDATQQASWYTFVRHLRDEYPDCQTMGERIGLYVADHIR